VYFSHINLWFVLSAFFSQICKSQIAGQNKIMFSDCETVDIISWYCTFYATEVLVEFYVFLCTLHKQRSNSSFAQLLRKK
jgi:hypothetical protein